MSKEGAEVTSAERTFQTLHVVFTTGLTKFNKEWKYIGKYTFTLSLFYFLVCCNLTNKVAYIFCRAADFNDFNFQKVNY